MSWMRKSLRWRLQIWHALILLVVVVGLGSILLQRMRASLFDEIEGELQSSAAVLEGVLRTLPGIELAGPPRSGQDRRPSGPPPRRPRPGDDRPGPPPRLDERGPRPDDAALLDDFLNGAPGHLPHEEQVLRALELPFWFAERHDHVDQPPFFVVWRPDGTVLKSAGITAENLPQHDDAKLRGRDARPYFTIGGDGPSRPPSYQIWMRGPGDSTIVVGRSIEPELNRLSRLTWQVIGAGTAVFAVGLLGGWWLSSSAIRPIAAMSDTAAAISANNLSQRVDLKEIDSELAELGSTLNEMLDRLEASFRQQTQFTSDASHELRTPLAVILSHIELALSQQRSADDYRGTLTTCQRAAQRMRTLVDDLLTLARADAGRLELRLSPVDLLQVARDATFMLEPLARQHQVQLVVEGTSTRATADAARMAQVVSNLVTNAIVYNRPQGQVTVSVGDASGLAVLKVTDTGIGIATHDLPRLFDRFYRVDRARSRDSGGSGLGLAISKSIVEAQQGTIEVTSKLDHGTTFVVRLPKAYCCPRGQ